MCCEPTRTRSSRYGITRALWRVIALTGLLWLALSVRASDAAVGTPAPIPAAAHP